eukprot:gene39227-12163_t
MKMTIVTIITHFVLSWYAKVQHLDFAAGGRPPAPAMLVFVVVKVFMVVRVVIVDFFVIEETILISIQFLFAVL